MVILTGMTLAPVFGEELKWESSTAIAGSPTNSDNSTHNFNIQYRIFNGTGIFQVHGYTFTANTYSKTNGMFEIQIPRDFPYYNGKNGPTSAETYVVIENGGHLTPNEYAKTTSDCFFTYSVPFHMNSTIAILSTDTLSLMTPIYGDKVPDSCMSEIVTSIENTSTVQNESTALSHFAIGTPLVLNLTSPLKQFKIGITANNVVCKKDFQLIIKLEDGSSACVKPDTAQILIERGWAKVSQS